MKIFALVFVMALMGGAFVYDMMSEPEVLPVEAAPVESLIDETIGAVMADGLIRDALIAELNGGEFQLRSLEEPIVLLHFWATWCAPCLVEFPMLVDLVKEMDGQVALVAVSMDYHQDALDRFIAEQDVDGLPIYWSRDKNFSGISKAFKVSQLPATFIIAPDRSVFEHVVGDRDWSSQDARQPLTALLSGSM